MAVATTVEAQEWGALHYWPHNISLPFWKCTKISVPFSECMYKTALFISWGYYDMSTLLFFMKDCYALVKEEWDFMNLKDLKWVSCELCIFSWKTQTKQASSKHKSLKNRGYFLIGEFWNVQTKQLFFQLLQVLNNIKKILCYDLSQEIILSWSCWTAGFIASLAIVIFNFSTCYLHNDSSKF